MIDWEVIIKVFVLSWWITANEYIQLYVNKWLKIKLFIPIKKILSCHVCSSWWIGLLYTQNIYTACFISFITYIYTRLENQIPFNFK